MELGSVAAFHFFNLFWQFKASYSWLLHLVDNVLYWIKGSDYSCWTMNHMLDIFRAVSKLVAAGNQEN